MRAACRAGSPHPREYRPPYSRCLPLVLSKNRRRRSFSRPSRTRVNEWEVNWPRPQIHTAKWREAEVARRRNARNEPNSRQDRLARPWVATPRNVVQANPVSSGRDTPLFQYDIKNAGQTQFLDCRLGTARRRPPPTPPSCSEAPGGPIYHETNGILLAFGPLRAYTYQILASSGVGWGVSDSLLASPGIYDSALSPKVSLSKSEQSKWPAPGPCMSPRSQAVAVALSHWRHKMVRSTYLREKGL
jgi:hypothetical protein